MKQLIAFLSLTFLTLTCAAQQRSDVEFHNLFMDAIQTTGGKALPDIHYILDDNLKNALQGQDLSQVLTMEKSSSIESLHQATLPITSSGPSQIENILRKKPYTIVVVPGIFAEFIANRAFEEVLRPNSAAKSEFNQILATAKAKQDPNAFDDYYQLLPMKDVLSDLGQVVNVSSIDDAQGKPLIKVVLLFTPFASLETLIDVKEQAQIFTRRLEKYLALSHDQNLILLGYSRGLTTALEMLSQAKAQNQSWLSNVRAVVSLSGVVTGSTLADQMNIPGSSYNKLATDTKTLINQLEVIPPNSGDIQKATIVYHNSKAWAEFIGSSILDLLDESKMSYNENQQKYLPQNESINSDETDLDCGPRGFIWIIKRLYNDLGLDHPVADYSNNIVRFKTAASALLTGTEELTTQSRLAWWKANQIPTAGIRYYGLGAAMADPAASALEEQIWKQGSGYSDSFDDRLLLISHREYTQMSGAVLNDSQVAIMQSQFIPGILQKLNPLNSGLQSAALGVLGTHHWGLALQVVNAMKDGRVNPFPRKAMLMAIGAKVIQDNP